MIDVGLVGFGLAGRVLHAPLIQTTGMRIAAVVTRQEDLVRSAIPEARVLPDLDTLLALPKLDLVVIATPNQLHAPQALAALEHGKHVVIDKPAALSVAECDRIVAAAERHQRQAAVFHNRRWDSDFLTLRRLLHEGALGAVLDFEARWDRYRPTVAVRWREHTDTGGGLLYDLGSHLIDQALCLFGWPEWLQADVYRQRSGALVDDGFVLRMGAGALRIELSASSVAAEAASRYCVRGLAASWRKHGLDVQEQQLRDGTAPDGASFGLEPETQWGRLVDGASQRTLRTPAERGDWRAFYEAMRRSIETGSEVPVSLAEARGVLAIIEAARSSSDGGKRINLRPQDQ
ncbi:MAG TPA: Gfo/Idh/MocA family oxidoreductase [Steroidobacteraceae bacterium]